MQLSVKELLTIENFVKDLPPNIQVPFKQLCKLAYSASFTKKRFFTLKELGQAKLNNTLGLLCVLPKITIFGTERYFGFPHLSLQEFLAAVHLLIKKVKVSDDVKKVLDHDPLSPVVPFYAGITGLANRSVFRMLTTVLNKPLEDRNTMAALQTEFTLANDRRRQALKLFNCLYECQNVSLVNSPEVYNKEFEKSKHALMNKIICSWYILCIPVGFRYDSNQLPSNSILC